MNEAAISDKQLAISASPILGAYKPLRIHPIGLIAYCLSLMAASGDAISFTVTDGVTSVTNPGLAESVLITIGEVYFGQVLTALETAKCKGLALLNCSFGEATCIQ